MGILTANTSEFKYSSELAGTPCMFVSVSTATQSTRDDFIAMETSIPLNPALARFSRLHPFFRDDVMKDLGRRDKNFKHFFFSLIYQFSSSSRLHNSSARSAELRDERASLPPFRLLIGRIDTGRVASAVHSFLLHLLFFSQKLSATHVVQIERWRLAR